MNDAKMKREPKVKPVHLAKCVNGNGGVSPLCAVKPRAIDMRRATWTNRDEAVTCAKCLLLMKCGVCGGPRNAAAHYFFADDVPIHEFKLRSTNR